MGMSGLVGGGGPGRPGVGRRGPLTGLCGTSERVTGGRALCRSRGASRSLSGRCGYPTWGTAARDGACGSAVLGSGRCGTSRRVAAAAGVAAGSSGRPGRSDGSAACQNSGAAPGRRTPDASARLPDPAAGAGSGAPREGGASSCGVAGGRSTSEGAFCAVSTRTSSSWEMSRSVRRQGFDVRRGADAAPSGPATRTSSSVPREPDADPAA
jgi:hypothetical protein